MAVTVPEEDLLLPPLREVSDTYNFPSDGDHGCYIYRDDFGGELRERCRRK